MIKGEVNAMKVWQNVQRLYSHLCFVSLINISTLGHHIQIYSTIVNSWDVPYNPGSSYKKAMPASQVNALLDWV